MGGVSFFPGGTVNTSSASKSKSKKPCKYGPRDDDGYCPKKPAAAKSTKGKKPCKYGARIDGYCPKKPSSYSGESSSGTTKKKPLTQKQKQTNRDIKKLGDALGSTVGSAGADLLKSAYTNRAAVKEAAKAVAKIPAKDVVKAAAAGVGVAQATLGLIAVAGVASYFLTSYIINRAPKKRAEMNAAAAQAAAAYKAARDEVVRQQKKPLTAAQNQEISKVFKAELKEIGVQWPLRS